eukprot:Ihof_evm12s5 gene=Ihof_evmTU12s5
MSKSKVVAFSKYLPSLEAARQTAVDMLLGSLQTHPSLRVKRIDETKGKGLFTVTGFKQGDCILQEAPLVAIQCNRDDLVTCASCFKPIGSVQLQMDIASRECSRNDVMDHESWDMGVDMDEAKLTEVIIPCPLGCGEYYCSVECCERDFAQGHRLLCVGPLDSTDHPLYQFKAHAYTNHEEFLMAGKILAAITTDYLNDKTKVDTPEGLWKMAQPYLHFHTAYWWDVADLTSDAGLTKTDLKLRARKSVGLLKAAFAEHGSGGPLAPLFTMEFFGFLVGTFELNDVGIRVTSPAYKFMKALQSKNHQEQEVVLEIVHEKVLGIMMTEEDGECSDEDCNDEECCQSHGDDQTHAEEEHEEEEDEGEMEGLDSNGRLDLNYLTDKTRNPFPPFDGTGLFSLTCNVNHSCD